MSVKGVEVGAASEISRVLVAPSVATSVGPLGTVAGVQFAGLVQMLVGGLRFQVALPAWAKGAIEARRNSGKRQRSIFMDAFCQSPLADGKVIPRPGQNIASRLAA